MKKIVMIFSAIMVMAISNLCFASDSSDFASEYKASSNFMKVFTQAQLPEYTVASKDFSNEIKAKIKEADYKKLAKLINNQYGKVKEVKFYTYQRFDNSDRLTYLASFDKESAVAIIIEFNKDKKIINYVFNPLKIEETSQK